MRSLLMLALTLALSTPAILAQEKIKWYTLEQAEALSKENPRPMLIDLYTTWCGWCKRMDAYTFANRKIAAYINERFYAVKLDAETRDTVRTGGQTFAPAEQGGVHPIAVALAGEKLGFPTLVFLDYGEKVRLPVPGYKSPSDLEPILHYIGTKAYKEGKSFEEFMKGFKSEL